MIFEKLPNLFFKLCFLLLIIGVTSCGSGGEEGSDQEEEEMTEEANETKESLQKVLTEVPKPSEMPYEIKNTGADFNESFPNDPATAEKYKTTNNKAALNLGVYATDVGYVSIYEKVDNAIKYIQATKELGDKLGISNAFDPNLEKRFEENLSQVDSLAAIINEALSQSDEYLKTNERNSIAAMIFTGSFVEGLYIATQLVDSYPKDILPEEVKNEILVNLVRKITEQDKPLSELITALESLDKEEEVDILIKDLKELKELYNKLEVKEKIANNEGNLMLTDETIQGITKKVKKIREEIVS